MLLLMLLVVKNPLPVETLDLQMSMSFTGVRVVIRVLLWSPFWFMIK